MLRSGDIPTIAPQNAKPLLSDEASAYKLLDVRPKDDSALFITFLCTPVTEQGTEVLPSAFYNNELADHLN